MQAGTGVTCGAGELKQLLLVRLLGTIFRSGLIHIWCPSKSLWQQDDEHGGESK